MMKSTDTHGALRSSGTRGRLLIRTGVILYVMIHAGIKNRRPALFEHIADPFRHVVKAVYYFDIQPYGGSRNGRNASAVGAADATRARRARWARPTEVSTDAMGTVELRRGGGDGTVPGAVAGDDRRASPAAR